MHATSEAINNLIGIEEIIDSNIINVHQLGIQTCTSSMLLSSSSSK